MIRKFVPRIKFQDGFAVESCFCTGSAMLLIFIDNEIGMLIIFIYYKCSIRRFN